MPDLLVTIKNWIRNLTSLVDQVLVSGGNFLTIAICAHLLPLSEQGKFTYVFASYMALLLLNVAGIFQGAAVRAPAQDVTYRFSLARVQLLQALLLSLLICAGWAGVGNIFGWQATPIEAALLFVFLVVQQLADFDRRSAYIFSNPKRAVYSSAALYPIRVIGLLIIHPETVSQVLWVLILSALIPAIPALIMASRKMPASAPSWLSTTKAHLAYSRLFIAGAPLGWLWSYIPIFMLGTIHGKEQAALLASVRGISNIANVLMEQIETKVVADWARMQHGEGPGEMKAAAAKLLKIGMALWLTGLLVTAEFGREIVTMVLGTIYAPAWHLLVIGWIGYGVYFLARVYGIKHRALGSNRIEFIGNLCGVMAALAAGFVLIPVFSANGAAWAYVTIATVMLISQMLVLNHGKKIEK